MGPLPPKRARVSSNSSGGGASSSAATPAAAASAGNVAGTSPETSVPLGMRMDRQRPEPTPAASSSSSPVESGVVVPYNLAGARPRKKAHTANALTSLASYIDLGRSAIRTEEKLEDLRTYLDVPGLDLTRRIPGKSNAFTVIHEAISHCMVEALPVLLHYWPPEQSFPRASKGRTPLLLLSSLSEHLGTEKQMCTSQELCSMASQLIDLDFDLIDKASKEGWTPLMTAAEFGCMPLTELLIQNGAQVDLQDREALTALHWAVPADSSAARLSHPDIIITFHEN